MNQFASIEKRDASMFSWLFSHPLTLTCYPRMVELIADGQMSQKTGVMVRQSRQGCCCWCCKSETALVHDRKEPVLLLRKKEVMFVKQGHDVLFISFPKS